MTQLRINRSLLIADVSEACRKYRCALLAMTGEVVGLAKE